MQARHPFNWREGTVTVSTNFELSKFAHKMSHGQHRRNDSKLRTRVGKKKKLG